MGYGDMKNTIKRMIQKIRNCIIVALHAISSFFGSVFAYMKSRLLKRKAPEQNTHSDQSASENILPTDQYEKRNNRSFGKGIGAFFTSLALRIKSWLYREKQPTKELSQVNATLPAYPPTHLQHDRHIPTHSSFRPRPKKRNFILSLIMMTMKIFVLLILIAGVSGFGAVLGVAKAYIDTSPVLDLAKIENQNQISYIYDMNDELITTLNSSENRTWATLDEIPRKLQQAFIAIEDERFYSHNGVDFKRIMGALFNNLRTDTTQGGSTITQQIIKLRLLSYEQTYKRKLQEAYLAMQLEQKYDKDYILEIYLNTIPLGGTNYGIKTAVDDYLGKPLDQLTLRECAMLAGITRSPYAYDPRRNFYKRENAGDRTNKRTDTVLKAMYKNGFISQAQYEYAITDELEIVEENHRLDMYEMPYFVEYALHDVVDHMIKDRGLEDNNTNYAIIEQEIRSSGLHIYTTVDPEIQLMLEDTIYNWNTYPRMQSSKDNNTQYKNPDGSISLTPQPQVSAVIMDHHTGYLVALVGGREDPQAKKTLNRVYQSKMGVGSSIKPIAVYGPALDLGYSPATVTYNVPAPIDGWDTTRGYPNNYGGGGFTGPTTLRDGLRKSLNVVAARTLLDMVSIEESYNYLKALGIDSSSINKDGSGLALGTSGISTLEMSGAFGAIANNGFYLEPLSFSKVIDSHNEVILDTTNQVSRQVFQPTTVWMLVDMMKQAITNGTGGRARIPGMTVAGKTGTNTEFRGVFFAGFTPYYTSTIWIGSDVNKSLKSGAQGGRDAAPLWQAYMSKLHEAKELPNKDILDTTAKELGLKKYTICGISGLRVSENCPKEDYVKDWFVPGTQPTMKCDLCQMENICSLSEMIPSPYCPETLLEERSIVVANARLRSILGQKAQDFFTNLDQECEIHTKEWHDEYTALKQNSLELIDEVDTLMSLYQYTLSSQQKDALNSAKANLRNAIESYLNEDIQAAYDSFNNMKKTYLSGPVVTPTPDPTLKPTPTPKVTPTDAPTIALVTSTP